MVTQKPISNAFASPTTPKRVWKPTPVTGMEGIPSMFAAATLSKPLKVNKVASNSVRRKTESETHVKPQSGTPMPENEENIGGSLTPSNELNVVPADARASRAEKDYSVVAPSSTEASKIAKERREKSGTNELTTKSAASPSKSVAPDIAKTQGYKSTPSQPETRAAKAAPSMSAGPTEAMKIQTTKPQRLSATKPTRTNSSGNSKVMGFGSTSVAGTPQSWPKPHAVPASEKQPPKKKKQVIRNQFSNTQDAVQIAPTTMDDLIPEMYRKKSAAQLEKEQQEEIYTMKKIMWELQRQERDREERALMAATKPIDGGIHAVMRKLKEAKEINDDCDSHASSLDSKTKKNNAYSTHLKSKLAYFNSNHSVSLDSNWDSDSDDSSSVSSWDSDAYSGDGLFR